MKKGADLRRMKVSQAGLLTYTDAIFLVHTSMWIYQSGFLAYSGQAAYIA
jgi:hypothetical protein